MRIKSLDLVNKGTLCLLPFFDGELWHAVLFFFFSRRIKMIRKMNVGDTKSYQRTITKADVLAFGTLTKDMNKAHFDEVYTKMTIFKKPIIHGMLLGSLFSKIFGLEYPGEGTIYCSQSLKFLKPAYPDQPLTVRVTVKEIILEKNRVIFTTDILNEQEELILTGEAMLMPRKEN
jgi:acyl dehydratase